MTALLPRVSYGPVKLQQSGNRFRRATPETALGRDAKITHHLLGRIEPAPGASNAIGEMYEAQIKFRFPGKLEAPKRREIRNIVAITRDWQMQPSDRPLDLGREPVRKLDHQTGVFRLHDMFVSRIAIAEM